MIIMGERQRMNSNIRFNEHQVAIKPGKLNSIPPIAANYPKAINSLKSRSGKDELFKEY
jgi:hypothetical protein